MGQVAQDSMPTPAIALSHPSSHWGRHLGPDFVGHQREPGAALPWAGLPHCPPVLPKAGIWQKPTLCSSKRGQRRVSRATPVLFLLSDEDAQREALFSEDNMKPSARRKRAQRQLARLGGGRENRKGMEHAGGVIHTPNWFCASRRSQPWLPLPGPSLWVITCNLRAVPARGSAV